jgi:hypothetical protein
MPTHRAESWKGARRQRERALQGEREPWEVWPEPEPRWRTARAVMAAGTPALLAGLWLWAIGALVASSLS